MNISCFFAIRQSKQRGKRKTQRFKNQYCIKPSYFSNCCTATTTSRSQHWPKDVSVVMHILVNLKKKKTRTRTKKKNCLIGISMSGVFMLHSLCITTQRYVYTPEGNTKGGNINEKHEHGLDQLKQSKTYES